MAENHNIILIVGKPTTGKSNSLQHFSNPKEVGYINGDRKRLPFNLKKAKFLANISLDDPEEIFEYIDLFEQKPELKIGVIDTITDIMKEFKIRNIDESSDTRSSWGDYQKFYNKLISKLKSSSKIWVILAHVYHHFDEIKEEDVSEIVLQGGASRAPIGDFTVVVEADSRVITSKFKKIDNELFKINDRDKQTGIKYFFITVRTKDNPATLARSADDMWDISENYIDNNIQYVINVVEEYYEDDEY